MSDKDATETISADAAGIARAAKILRSGGLVALPTETVYGLAARADSDAAVARIYEAKGRPSFNPLIVHVESIEQAKLLADFSDEAEAMARRVWPGAVTLVLPRKEGADLALAVSAGLDTVALRIPDHPVMRAVIEATGAPLAAPSANRSNAVSPTTAEHVVQGLDGRIAAVLDGGPSEKGLESNILALRRDGTWEELRAGPVPLPAIARTQFAGEDGLAVEAPGQLAKHYSPGKPVRLNVNHADADEFFIGFGPEASDFALSLSGNMEEAAARLYCALHAGAASEKRRIAVAEIPDEGVGRAINDRLKRASA